MKATQASRAVIERVELLVETLLGRCNLRQGSADSESQNCGGAESREKDPGSTGFFFEPVFRVSIPASDGTAFNLEKDRFEFLAEHFGLAPSDYGREFRTGSKRFRITGIDPKRPRYPISAERIPDRRGFKFAAENVAMLLQAKENKP